MNQKDLRILKLLDKGLDEAQVARKIGYGFDLDLGIARVREAKQRAGRMPMDRVSTG